MGLSSALTTTSISGRSRGFSSRPNFRRGASTAVVAASPTWEERREVGQEPWGTPVMSMLRTEADTLGWE